MSSRDVSRRRWPRRAVNAAAVVALSLSCACTSEAGCQPRPEEPGCPDLRFSGNHYDEWRATRPPPILQELGDAAYPACNDAEHCGARLGGFGATDVWLLEGVDARTAVIGYRQNTDTYVIFVRRGLDPQDVAGLRRAG